MSLPDPIIADLQQVTHVTLNMSMISRWYKDGLFHGFFGGRRRGRGGVQPRKDLKPFEALKRVSLVVYEETALGGSYPGQFIFDESKIIDSEGNLPPSINLTGKALLALHISKYFQTKLDPDETEEYISKLDIVCATRLPDSPMRDYQHYYGFEHGELYVCSSFSLSYYLTLDIVRFDTP